MPIGNCTYCSPAEVCHSPQRLAERYARAIRDAFHGPELVFRHVAKKKFWHGSLSPGAPRVTADLRRLAWQICQENRFIGPTRRTVLNVRGLFDEHTCMPQSNGAMKLIGKTLILGILTAAFWVTAAQEGEAERRPLTLRECIQLAIQNNLELQIERYNPQLALFGLKGSYGAYDPTLALSGQHRYSKSGETLFQGRYPVPGQKTETDSFNSSVGGLLPWGTRYNLSATATDTDGTRFEFDPLLGQVVSARYSVSGGSVTLDVTQPLLKNFWIDQPRLTIRVAKNRLKSSELALKLKIMTTLTAVEQAYYDLIAMREQVKVQEMALELALRLVEENRKRVEVGTMAPLDEQQAEAQAAAIRADLISARNALAIQGHQLKRLIAAEYSEWTDVVPEPVGALEAPVQVFDRQLSWARGLSQRPEILQAKLNLETAGIQLKFDYNQLFPQLDLRAGGGYAGSTPEFSGVFGDIERREQPFYYFGGQLTFPIGNTAARNNYRASKAAVEQAMLSLKAIERDIMVQIDDAIRQAQASYERVAATRKAREYAQAALEAEQKKLESGKSTTYTVLQLQRDLTAARANEIQALDNYNKALAQLSLAEGTTLDRLGINIEVR